ncbi:Amino acid or gaba permease [Trichoderma simmonsii]|uniref:Amino acid or gaba permease n=1 Tax=Trichoderma simmonsii TaxID=1491479 RepID=A0A8G0PJ89_9HYPO|nr:Amino acid or gaba permease [Trichoderma simmonsii]
MASEKRDSMTISQSHDSPSDIAPKALSNDEYQLAQLGYKQEFFRTLGLFENWAATFTTMNFISGIPMMFAFVMSTGGPEAAFANWTMVGGFSFIVSLAMAEIASALPVAGGIYYWSFYLGGKKWGPFLSWMTAWWNWAGWITVPCGVQQGATNFLISALEIQYPNAEVLTKGWFSWILTSVGILIAMLPNIISPRVLQLYFRFAILIFFSLFFAYWIWFPTKASGNFQPSSGVFQHFFNNINEGDKKQASDGYCWVISTLFGAWIFFGYDASAHLAEETKEASAVVAKGMWMATLSGWLLSIPTLILILFCIQDFDGIIAATYANNWAEYLMQLIGPAGSTAILVLLWIDSTCATASAFMSAQRVTYAISRDNVLPFSRYFRKLTSTHRMPLHAAFLVAAISIAISTAVIGSSVAFSAITAMSTIATNVSYLFPIIARQTVGAAVFVPAKWNLGRASPVIATISSVWICYLFVVLLLPQVYPVTGTTLNYAPVMIGAITLISLVGWVFPFGLGGKYWFKGPQTTITDVDVLEATIPEMS